MVFLLISQCFMSGCCSIFRPYIRFDVGDYISNVYVKNSPCLKALAAAKKTIFWKKNMKLKPTIHP